MTICVRPNGSEDWAPGPCPAGTTAKAPASTGQSTGQSGGQTTAPATNPTRPDGPPARPTGPWMPRPEGDIFVNTSTMTGVSNASDTQSPTYNAVTTSTSAESQYMNYPGYHSLFNAIAEYNGGRSGAVQFANFVQQSADLQMSGVYRTPFQLAIDYAVRVGIIQDEVLTAPSDPSGGGGRSYGGGGGSVGPMPVDQSAAKRMMDSLATSLLGRTLSEDEFKDYYADYTRRFAGNPAMDIQQDATEALQTQEDYQEYQVAGKFAQAMQSVIKGAM